MRCSEPGGRCAWVVDSSAPLSHGAPCLHHRAMTTVERVAARIIARSDAAHPADAVLRAELKAERLTRAESRRVAESVFGWFRWRGWLDASNDVAAQLPR